MSKSQREKNTEQEAPDPAKAMQEMYEQFWKQAAGQWDEVARSPQVLSLMAANLNQSLELKARVQETVVALLRTMNIPSRDDLAAIATRINEIGKKVDYLGQKLDMKIADKSTSSKSKPSPQKKTAPRVRKKA